MDTLHNLLSVYPDEPAGGAGHNKRFVYVDDAAAFTITNQSLIICDPGAFGAAQTVNLPPISTNVFLDLLRTITIKNDTLTGSLNVTILPDGGETIEGSISLVLKKGESVELAPNFNTSNWSII